jgi:uncharacterized protein YtpQ (UPF0354 family)
MGLFDSFKTNRKTFARRVERALRSAGLSEGLEYDEESFCFRGEQTSINLENVYQEFRSLPRGERQSVIASVVQTVGTMKEELPDSWEAARDTVMPVVRSQAYYHLFSLQLRLEGSEQRMQPRHLIADAVAVDIALDRESSIAILPEGTLADWEISFDEALDHAVSNLRRRSGQPMEELQGGLFSGQWGDSYDSSRILIPDLLYRHKVKGNPVVMAPVRDWLLLTGDRDEGGLAAMAELAAEALEHSRWVTFQMLRHTDAGWDLFAPPNPAAATLRRLQLKERATDYNQQKEILDAIHERDGREVFVPSFIGIADEESGETLSTCFCVLGVENLIPEVDTVSFADPLAAPDENADIEPLAWQEAVARLGELVQPVEELWPPRHRLEPVEPGSEPARRLLQTRS